MSDFFETALLRYEEEQDQLAREEREREENPKKYWFIVTDEWEEYADSREEADGYIEMAKKDGVRYSCTEHIEGERY